MNVDLLNFAAFFIHVLLSINVNYEFEFSVLTSTNNNVQVMWLQVTRLNSSYPGGLASYIKTARELLADSRAGKNPFDGFTPSVG